MSHSEASHAPESGAEFALLYAVDEAFSSGTLVSLASALATSDSSRFRVYIAYDQEAPLGDSFWDSVRRIFKHWRVPFERCSALPICMDSVAELPEFYTGSHMNYGRLVAFDSIPERLCLYLDSDTMVMEDLSELVDSTEANMECAAVLDKKIATHRGDGYSLSSGAIDPDTPYFNSGVMCINTESWRANNLCGAVIETAQRCSVADYRDQTYLNVILHDKVQYLPSKWNACTLRGYSFPVRFSSGSISPAILHFVGHHKPWDYVMMDLPNLLWHSFAATFAASGAVGVRGEWVRRWFRFKVSRRLGLSVIRLKFYRWKYRRRQKVPRKLRNLEELYRIDRNFDLISEWLDSRGATSIL